MSSNLENALEAIKQFEKILSSKIIFDQLEIEVDKNDIIDVLSFLKEAEHFQFRQLSDVAGVDYPNKSPRFEVVYHLLDFKQNIRLRIKSKVGIDETIPSITSIFPCANWYERETFDMYGIEFTGHPDLRRLLTDYNFEGFPLRKDFPLTGTVEVRYSEIEKKVIYEPVKLQQDFRSFDIQSPWEGTKYEDTVKPSETDHEQ
jgi:NADH-quinone oxidoreductase subunit C|tara:strand:- start:15884 stop:16489 length:606 start_codon:yes stop_codon:yes gene_type:complete